jgi:hypothetical protein
MLNTIFTKKQIVKSRFLSGKKIFTLLLSVIASGINAQPTLTSANEATVGTSLHYIFVDSSTAQPGSSGANQTWNFSTIIPNGLSHTDEWVSVASTPYAANFPGTNIVQLATDTAGNDVYLYHNITSSSTELKGMGVDAATTPYIMNYSNPETIKQFPVTYNSTFSDNFSGLATITFGPVTLNIYRYGTYSYLADAYGTLITPSATYPNTLRGKINQHITDSMVYSGVPLPTQLIQNISTTYFWASADAGDKLYQFYIGYDTVITSTSTAITNSVSYLDDVTAIEETPPYETATAAAYPNPANDYAFITLDNPVNGTAELSLYDLKGSIVKNISAEMKAASRYQWMFPVSDLPGGIYHARITCGDKQWQTKIVKN